MDPFRTKTVSYFYDEEIGNFCYGGGNPMRPHRARLTYSLVENYGLFERLKIRRPVPQEFKGIAAFHADEYVDFLNTVTPDNQEEYLTQMRRFNLGPAGEADCPVFDGLFEYCQIYSGGSVDGAALLASGKSDICLNWSGGMHHAKKAEASGFCYINDIVLAILELLKTFQRVLYVDIDIHHGDGVEEAFYITDRVMTVSFHKYGDFFPGTGAVGDIGYGDGKYYALNVPLQEGMDDESYRTMFEPIMQKVMETYQPGAVVVCAGADSLSGDRLGCFNLSLEGHSNCIEFLGRFNVPMLVLGGGGYTMRNVARCWTYETGRLNGIDLPDQLPEGALQEYDYYMDTHKLRIATSNMKNANSKEQMEKIKEECLRNLSKMPAAPSVPFSCPPPRYKEEEGPEEDIDERGGGRAAYEERVNKFEDNTDDDQPEPGANRHRGGREHTAPPGKASAPRDIGPTKDGLSKGRPGNARPVPKAGTSGAAEAMDEDSPGKGDVEGSAAPAKSKGLKLTIAPFRRDGAGSKAEPQAAPKPASPHQQSSPPHRAASKSPPSSISNPEEHSLDQQSLESGEEAVSGEAGTSSNEGMDEEAESPGSAPREEASKGSSH